MERTKRATTVEEAPASPGLPVVVLVTRSMEPDQLTAHPDLACLARRFDLRLTSSPSRALSLSRDLLATGNRIVLLLSDMVDSGTDVHGFLSAFCRCWPEAGFHLIDTVEGRVIFSETDEPCRGSSPSIRIESNGRESLSGRLVRMMVERYCPKA